MDEHEGIRPGRTGRAVATAAIIFFGLLGDACGGKTDNGGGGAGGAGGAGGSGATGGGPAGGYGGAPVGGYGGAPVGGYGGGPVGGYGGTVIGGYGGTMYGGGGMPVGGYGGAGGIAGCGTCPSFMLAGLINLAPCCAPDGNCGSLVDPTVAQLVGATPGCYELNQPGKPDPSCPIFQYTDPTTGAPAIFPGCCRAQSGTCGYYVDLTSKQGPSFGCTELNGGAGATGQSCGGTVSCSTCAQTQCAAELNACIANPDCSALLQCASSCMDMACVQKCVATHPAGQPGWIGINQCMQAKCAGCV